MLKVELHTHTSDDPVDAIPYSAHQLIDRAVGLGYHALAVTLHDRQLDPAPLSAYARQRGLALIPGIERTIDGRHVLLLNFSRATEEVGSFRELARLRAHEPCGLVVAPHPFYPIRTSLRRLMDRHAALFDAVEYNAMFTSLVDFNRRAVGWARAHGKPMVGNGDVHRLGQLGSTYSLVDAEPTADAICAAIRQGRVQVQARPLPAFSAAFIAGQMLLGVDISGRRPQAVLAGESR